MKSLVSIFVRIYAEIINATAVIAHPPPFFKHINVLLSAVFIFICTDSSHILTQPVGGSLDSFW